jgi:hypothetical protein
LGGVGVSLSCILSLILVLVVQVFQNYEVQENINIIKIINSTNETHLGWSGGIGLGIGSVLLL